MDSLHKAFLIAVEGAAAEHEDAAIVALRKRITELRELLEAREQSLEKAMSDLAWVKAQLPRIEAIQADRAAGRAPTIQLPSPRAVQ